MFPDNKARSCRSTVTSLVKAEATRAGVSLSDSRSRGWPLTEVLVTERFGGDRFV